MTGTSYTAAICMALILVLGASACRQDSGSGGGAAESVRTEKPEVRGMVDSSGIQIGQRFRTPEGYERVPTEEGSFGAYLRKTPLRPADAQVYFYMGNVKYLQNVYAGVIAYDITSNALTGVDCISWFHSEYMFRKGEFEKMVYPLSSGFEMDFSKWAQGYRTYMKDNEIFYQENREKPDSSYAALRNFQQFVWSYADNKSVKSLLERQDVGDLGFGTVFVSDEKWGHGVIVVDVAEDPETGDRVFLLAQSFMPAQEMQVLQNPIRRELSPWYSVSDIDSLLVTPEWTFQAGDCYQFKDL